MANEVSSYTGQLASQTFSVQNCSLPQKSTGSPASYCSDCPLLVSGLHLNWTLTYDFVWSQARKSPKQCIISNWSWYSICLYSYTHPCACALVSVQKYCILNFLIHVFMLTCIHIRCYCTNTRGDIGIRQCRDFPTGNALGTVSKYHQPGNYLTK